MAISFLLLYALFLAPPPAATVADTPVADHNGPAAPAEQTTPSETVASVRPEPQPAEREEVTEAGEPASRQMAEACFGKAEFGKAMALYQRLSQRLASANDSDGVRDYLALRMAMCARGQGELEQAVALLKRPINSRLPVIRALARYHLGLVEMQHQQYLEAASEIHQGLSLIDALQGEGAWTETFKEDCRFLVAKAVTLEALNLRETPEDWPASMWPGPSSPDLWAPLDDDHWRQVLQSGSRAFGEASVASRIDAVADGQGTPRLWRVIANGSPLEEVLMRFCSQAKVDLKWSVASVSGTITVDQAVRKRPLFVYIDGATQQEVLAQVAGAARLWVGADTTGVATLVDPFNYRTLGEHIAGLRQQAVSLWHQFRLASTRQDTLPTSHFALGLLYEQNGQTTQALSEFGLLVSRFPQSDLAPQALMRSSRVCMDLRDYSGARQLLSQLVGQYPQEAASTMALAALGDATMKAGLLDDAVRVYTKAFHTAPTAEARSIAAFKAGQCLYQQQQYEQGLRWLTRCFDSASRTGHRGPAGATLLLGRTCLALGRYGDAAEALDRALDEPSDRAEYMEALSGLVQAHVGQDDCVKALNALDREPSCPLTRKDRLDISILKAQVLRTMGLAERAISLLEEGLGSAHDSGQRVQVYAEMAACHEAMGQWEPARNALAQVLLIVEPGPVAQQTQLELARVSLKLGRPDRAVSLCRQVLDAGPDGPTQQKAAALLATAYEGQHQYSKAVESLMSSSGGRKSAPLSSGPQGPSKEVTRGQD
jgi:tetratricopeptide (TPR) repeat protein